MEGYLGELCAILAAVSWTISNFAFQSNISIFSPMMLNFAKCSISTLFLLIVLPLCGIELFPLDDFTPYIRLMLSGICGIAIGDSFFLAALHELGARKTLLVETLAPPMTGIIAYIYYGTTISLTGWIGIALTLYGLYIVVVQKQGENHAEKEKEINSNEEQLIVISDMSASNNQSGMTQNECEMTPAKPTRITQFLNKGILYGAAAMLCQSLGIVLSSSVLTNGLLNPLSATLVRIAPANLVLFPILKYYRREKFEWPRHFSFARSLNLVAVILASTVVVIWMIQLSLVYTRPEISQTLIATSPLFGLLIGKCKGEVITPMQVFGSFISVFGVFLIVLV